MKFKLKRQRRNRFGKYFAEETGGAPTDSTGGLSSTEGSVNDSGSIDPNAGGDTAKIMKALTAEREVKRTLEKQLSDLQKRFKAFEGVDPEAAKRASQIIAEQEEWAAREAKIRSETEESLRPTIKEWEAKYNSTLGELHSYITNTALQSAYSESGGLPGEFQAVEHALSKRVLYDPATKKIKVLTADGKPAYVGPEPMTLPQLVEEMKKEAWFARHFRGSEKSGLGIGGSGTGGAGVDGWENLDPWQQVNILRSQQGR